MANFAISCSFLDLSEELNEPPPKRFKPISDEEVLEIAKLATPKNTIAKRQWAFRVYVKWSEERGIGGDLCTMSLEDIDFHLSKFICEARTLKGETYPPKTLYELISNIQGYLRDRGLDVSFFEKTSMTFRRLRSTLDGMMRKTSAEGEKRAGE